MKPIVNLLCLLFVSSCSLFAQDKVQELLKNPDIIWAAEYYSDFHPDKGYEEHQALGLKFTKSIFIKFLAMPWAEGIYLNNEADCIYRSRHFTEKIFNETCFKKNKFYFSDDFSKELTAEEKTALLNMPDTIVTFDPDTFEEIIQYVINPFDFTVSHYKIKQVVYYNKKDTMFRVIPIAIAPVINQYSKLTGEKTGSNTPFWMRVEEAATTDLHNPDLDLIKRTAYLVPLLENPKILKEQVSLMGVLDSLFDNLAANPNKALLYETHGLLGSEPMNLERIKTLKNYTIQKFAEDEWKIVETLVSKTKDISELQAVQDWIWDDKKQKLFIAYKGFSLILNRYDNNGIFLCKEAMFYRREKSVKKG